MEDNGIRHAAEVQKYFEENGVTGIAEFLKKKLEESFNVEINIGVTGDSGAGKSSFINAIRGLKGDDEGAARTGVNETTTEPTVYSHPDEKFQKIKFWDLPGIGSPNYPDLKTYCEKINLEKYDTFLIFTAFRFTENNLKLAKKVKSIKKSFFFVRTKIDQDIQNESRRKTFNEEAMLNTIRENCEHHLKGLVAGNEDVFLVSNDKTAKWDFDRLRLAIMNALPLHQKECLTLSFTNFSRDLIKRKVDILRGRIWIVATISAVLATVQVPGVPVAFDCAILTKEMNLYKSELGIPDKDSQEFQGATPGVKKILKYCVTGGEEIKNLLKACVKKSTDEEIKYLRLVERFLSGGISFGATYYFLNECLKEVEEKALNFLDGSN